MAAMLRLVCMAAALLRFRLALLALSASSGREPFANFHQHEQGMNNVD
jgi:hypothetical protein